MLQKVKYACSCRCTLGSALGCGVKCEFKSYTIFIGNVLTLLDFDIQLERNEYAARETAKGKEHSSLVVVVVA